MPPTQGIKGGRLGRDAFSALIKTVGPSDGTLFPAAVAAVSIVQIHSKGSCGIVLP